MTGQSIIHRPSSAVLRRQHMTRTPAHRPRSGEPARIGLWLPLTPLFLLLAPLSLLTLPIVAPLAWRWGANPLVVLAGIGSVLLSLGGTAIVIDGPRATVRILIF